MSDIDTADPRAGVPSVAVLMGVLDGARFLIEQLDSIASQEGVSIRLLVSDDGSHDGSPALVAEWSRTHPQIPVDWRKGPGRGFAENFRQLVLTAPDADFYAFSDQDDVWLPDKLAAATARLASAGDRPAVYGARTRLVDEAGQPLGLSPLFSRSPDFRNALVQSILGGNTLVFNRPALAALRISAGRSGFVSHDWWAYLVTAGIGGEVIYDPEPHVLYRQHARNLVGANTGWPARLSRLKRLLRGEFRAWSGRNLATLDAIPELLTPAAKAQLEAFRTLHDGPVGQRLGALRATGFYRQGEGADLSLLAAVVLKLI